MMGMSNVPIGDGGYFCQEEVCGVLARSHRICISAASRTAAAEMA